VTSTLVARAAREGDLAGLLALFAACEVSQIGGNAGAIWGAMLDHPGTTTFVSEAADRIVATCTLITAPNLLREGRAHAFLENVMTHPLYRRTGHGHAVVQMALDHAWANDCHHVLMQSGRADPGVRRFYESVGFVPDRRTAYVTDRPK
jgi:GNAT superfamily N-acetyltransferase